MKHTSCATVVVPRTRVAADRTRSHHLRVSVTRVPARVVATAQTRPRPFSKRVPRRARALTCQCWTSPVHRLFHRLRARAAVAGWRTATLIATRSPRVQAIGPVTRTSLPLLVGGALVDRVGGDEGARRLRSGEQHDDESEDHPGASSACDSFARSAERNAASVLWLGSRDGGVGQWPRSHARDARA